jgi:hypothetical protein
MRRLALALALAFLTAAPSLMPPLPADGPAAGAGRAEPAPPWAVGCSWKWVADQSVSFCMTFSSATIRINRITGDMVDRVTNLTVENGTDVYLVEAKYSETLTGTLTIMGFPAPISWPATGNGTFLYRVPDLALVYSYQHIVIDMGSLIGTFTLDTSTAASPPAGYYRFPLETGGAWEIHSDLTVWTRTTAASGSFEVTGNDRLDQRATVPRMEDAAVSAGTLSCYNITYNGTYTSGGSSSPQNASALYSPKATNLALRHFSPMAGLEVVFALSEYSLNHAPAAASPVPEARFPEDTTGTLDLYTVFSDPDAGDRLGFSAENFTNISTAVDNATGTATFTPPPDWSGSEKVVFTASDAKGARARAEVSVTVTPVNDAPVLLRPLPGIIMDEDTVNDTLNLSEYFDDVDFPYGDRLAYSFEDNGSIGVGISPSGVAALRPFENWSGVQNITITATDWAGAPAEGLLKVAVLNTPDAPVIGPAFGEIMMVEDTRYVDRIWVVDGDIPYGDVLTYSVDYVPTGFSIELDQTSGTMKIIPPKDYNGRNPITIIVTDRFGLNCSQTLMIHVREVNDPPAIPGSFPGGDKRTIAENTSTDFSVVAADVDNPYTDLHFTWYFDGKKAATGANYTYFADFESSGSHNLTAVVDDGLDNVFRTWNLTVTNVNRPPENVSIISPANGTNLPYGAKANFTAAASDPDGDALTFTWKDTNGKVLGAGRSFETKSLSKGKHVVTLEVSDGNATASKTVTISVVPPPEQRTPGFPAVSLLAAAAVSTLVFRARRPARICTKSGQNL